MTNYYLSKTTSLIKKNGITVLIVLLLSMLVGYQIFNPSKRVIEAVAGLAFITIIARFPLFWSLSFFLLAYPFPFALKVGNSNVVFIPLMIIIWLIRISLGTARHPRGSILDAIIVMMTITYIISLYNNPGGGMLTMAVLYIWRYLTAVGLFYLIVNFVQDEEALRGVVKAGVASCFLVMVFCVLEMIMPGKTLIPGWLYTGHEKRLIMENVRIAGPFNDFELLAEFLALNVPILILLFIKSRRLLYRYTYFSLIILCLGLLIATSTRGAFISLIIGAIYMLIVIRKDLDIVKVGGILLVAVLLMTIEEAVVKKYTISAGMFERLKGTKFIGYLPDTRVRAWPKAWNRAREHLIIGHSPAWDMSRKLERFNWPHNGYLYYLNITGILGLLSFLLLLFTLLRSTIKLKAKSIYEESFPRTLMLMLHVILVIFIIDELKIDYLRNTIYIFFIWYIFGLIAATHNIIENEEKNSRPLTSKAV